MGAHTPGPWGVYLQDELVIVDSEGSSLGEMTPGDPYIDRATAAANARLVAVAPELLDALRDAIEALAMCEPRTRHWADCQRRATLAGQAAIAKATRP